MNEKRIKQIQEAYKQSGRHDDVMKRFGINHAQEYAINILGRDNGLSAKEIHAKIHLVVDGMNVGQVQEIFGVSV